MKRAVVAIALVALLTTGILVLRARTMSRHTDQDPTSAVEVVVDVDATGGRSTSAMGRALVDSCQFEVNASVVDGSWAEVADDTYRVVLEPALDATDERQLRGCIGDMRMNYAQGEVVRMRRLSG